MTVQERALHPEESFEHEQTLLSVISGSVAEGFAGVGAAVLAILGLSGVLPHAMLYVATIVIGAALLLNGIGIAARFSRLMSETVEDTLVHKVELGSGTTAEALGGIAGIALGILALVGIAPATLTSIAAIVFGAAILLGSGIDYRLNTITLSGTEKGAYQNLARQAVAAAADVQVLVGLAAIALGILALIGIVPLVLTLVAMLSVGTANFLSGTAVSGRLFEALHR